MSPEKILFIDTETGGVNPETNSLLSLALVVWQDSVIAGSIEILINDGVFNVTPKAMEINGINLEDHKKKAVPPAVVIQKMDTFLSNHFSADEKITLGGHNINFDVNFLKHFLQQNNYNFYNRFSHRFIDTATILFYLYLTNKIKYKAVSSSEAFALFGITVEGRHTALGDAIATASLFSKLLAVLHKSSKHKGPSLENLPSLFE